MLTNYKGRNAKVLAMAILAIVLGGCASAVSDQVALSLGKGEGLVGMEFVTAWGDADYQVKVSGGVFGTMLKMNDAPKGESVYLYKLPAGHYCIEALYLTGSNSYLEPAGFKPCFNVSAGKLTYGTSD